MLSMRSNMLAIGAKRQALINDRENAKATEKLASGYRINRAADDAAGLSISEKMRRQIRGLMQGTYNAQDGASFVQVADGAMDEIHGMLQRMNELTIKSLNDTCSARERAALNDEMDQLRSEIDRIGNETQFNNQTVFEEHEDSYYQLAGNRRWNDSQLHTVPSMANDLVIHLPDTYVPDEYSITVPPGVYTTQELIDEIDDAMNAMVPFNPGFVLEYTDEGFCNLNFENPYGKPTDITTVDGALAYLLYDFYGGSASTSLLGTTVFEGDNPLPIVRGENDQLGFYVEGKNGSNYVSITFPPKSYTRTELIDFINSELKKNPDTVGVVAKEYTDTCIQITGGDGVSIVGLKGNMFKYESAGVVYTSVFYDNAQYGNSYNTNSYITGNSTQYIIVSNANNKLRLKIDGEASYTEIEIPNGKYTPYQLATEINKKLDPALSGKIEFSTRYSGLELSSKSSGSNSKLEFDTSAGIYGETYKNLFLTSIYEPSHSADGNVAYVTGAADLSKGITLDAADVLKFHIDDQQYTIGNIQGTYKDLNELVNKLLDTVKTVPGLDGKIEFAVSGNNLVIRSKVADIKKIDFSSADQNDTYKKLFTGSTTYIRSGNFTTGYSLVQRPQGSTQVIRPDATASATIPSDMLSKSITIDNSCNQMYFSIGGYSRMITLRNDSYSIGGLVAEINRQIQNSGDKYLMSMKVTYSNGKMNFTSTPPLDAPSGGWYVYNSYSGNTAWKAILGTYESPVSPTATPASNKTITTSYAVVNPSVTLDDTNNKLTLNIGDGDVDLVIDKGAYNSGESLKDAVKRAIDGSGLKDKVLVDVLSDGRLQLTATSKLDASGSFYDEVLTTKNVASRYYDFVKEGSNSYTPAFIIGRQDLTGDPIEITADSNDMFTFDFTYNSSTTAASSYTKEINIKIPEGIYSGTEIASLLKDKIQEKFVEEGLADFEIEVRVGGRDTHVVGSNDLTALQIEIKKKSGKEPAAGDYILDGIRGSAAGYLFYKTTIRPIATYITGTKDITNGVTFKPGQNVLTLSADSVPYQYTFPENSSMTAEELISFLNDKFENGDDNGNKVALRASIENGALKISHKALGSHTITDIGGSARGPLFFEEGGKNSRNPLTLLVGAESGDSIELGRTRVNSCALRINSITLSRPKYANKALNRIKEAISLVSSKRSAYGTMHNRLEHTISVNKNVVENTQASESAVRDADMSSEIMKKTQVTLILQASQTMLAQANQQASQVVDLLRQ